MSWFGRLKEGLSRSAGALGQGLASVFGSARFDAATLHDLEELLIASDLGVKASGQIAAKLGEKRWGPRVPAAEARAALADAIAGILQPAEQPLDVSSAKPFVILVVGVNGTGKTTTIGKLSARLRGEGRSVLLVAGDTFRAAAIEQLKAWSERSGAPILARDAGADAAGLAFDAVAQAKAQGHDVVLIDTAGRLQNKANLMAELAKIVRVLKKVDATAPHAVLLVLDATTGQNARAQVAAFKELVQVSGLIMTKLDGTARGGMLVALADEFGLPIHYVGVGERIEDLQPFDAQAFSRALVGLET
ncbi:MAG: signal recognition particle-docking protein FtsY [Alphaproteobacteria bacterium]|nr:signal recognition particle-docking protein FtsY [Alphaproteobacteria bacterium]